MTTQATALEIKRLTKTQRYECEDAIESLCELLEGYAFDSIEKSGSYIGWIKNEREENDYTYVAFVKCTACSATAAMIQDDHFMGECPNCGTEIEGDKVEW